MFVRFIDGSRKGQVCDVMPLTARHLCAVGLAVDMRDEVEAQEVSVTDDTPPAPKPPAPKRKGKRNKAAKKARR